MCSGAHPFFRFDNRPSFPLKVSLPFHHPLQEVNAMNTQTLMLTVLIFWLIMGLAFLSAYSEIKRTGGTIVDAMRNNETFFFIISIVMGLVVIAFKVFG
jgi:hypothetical protein